MNLRMELFEALEGMERRPQHRHDHRGLPLHRRRLLRLPQVRGERGRQHHPQPARLFVSSNIFRVLDIHHN